MKVKCINNIDMKGILEIGKIYTVEKEEGRYYHLKETLNIGGCYWKTRFEKVRDDKTNSNSITKKDIRYLNLFTRQELRNYAKKLGVRIGRDKRDTIRNLISSGLAYVTIKLGD